MYYVYTVHTTNSAINYRYTAKKVSQIRTLKIVTLTNIWKCSVCIHQVFQTLTQYDLWTWCVQNSLGPGARGWKWIGCPPPPPPHGQGRRLHLKSRGRERIRAYICGWEHIEVIVCCPKSSIITICVTPSLLIKYLCPLRSESKKSMVW